jgi:hypothetical protein
LMNSLNFTESTVEDLLKIKVCCIQKAYVNRDLRFNALRESYEFGIEYEQEEDFNVNPRDISKGLIKRTVCSMLRVPCISLSNKQKNNCHDTKKRRKIHC